MVSRYAKTESNRSNNLATSNEEIVDALTRSSAAMAEAGNSLTDTISLESASIEVVRNAETVGQAYKTIAMRLQGLDEETGEVSEDLVDLHGKLADLTKTAKTPGGISIYTNAETKELKSTKQLLTDIHDIYEDLNEKQQAQVRELIGGKRGGQVVGSLLRNWEAVEKATEVMENSAGSADREVGIASDSIEFHLNALKETWVGIMQSITDRGAMNGIIDFLTTVSSLLNGIANIPGLGEPLSLLGMVGGGIASAKGLDVFTRKAEGGIQFNNPFKRGGSTDVTAFTHAIDIIGNLQDASSDNIIKVLSEDFKNASESAQIFSRQAIDVARTSGDAEKVIGILNGGLEHTQKSSKLAAFGVKTLSTAFDMLIGAGIGLAIQGIISVIDNLIHAEERTKEASESLASDLEKFNSSVNKNANEFSELAKTYHELSSGVDDLGRNIGLTDEQFKTYNDTVNKMVDMDQSIVKFWNDQGQAIIDVGENLDETNKKYQETLQLQARKKLEGDEENDIPSIQKIYDNINNYSDSSSDQNRDKMNQYKKLLDMTNSANENQKKLFKELLGYNKTVDTLSFGFFSDEDIKKQYQSLSQALDEIKDKYGSWLDDVISEDKIEKEWDQIVAYIKEQIDSLDTELSSREKQFQSGLQTQFESMDEYWQLDETGVNLVSQLIGSMDDEMRQQLGLKSPEEGRVWLEGITQSLMENSDLVSDAYQQILTINESDLPVDKAYEAIMKYINQLASLLKQDPEQIKKMFGFNSFFGELVPAYDRAIALGSNGTYGSVQGAEGKGFTNSVGMKQTMAENSINTTEEINDFIKILQVANSLDDAIQRYNARIVDTTDETKTFKQLWKELGDKDTKAARNELLELAKSGKLSVEAFENFKKGKYAKMFEDIGVSAGVAVDKINKMAQTVDQMSSMKTGISAILSAYDEKQNDENHQVGSDTLASLGSTLGVGEWKDKESLKVWDEYQKIAASSTTTLEDLKKAQDDLATSYVNSEYFLANVDEEHRQYYEDLLTEMGVTNAAEVVTDALAQAKLRLKDAEMDAAFASSEFADGTIASIDDLTALFETTGATSQQIAHYIIELVAAGRVTLSTNGSIANLAALGETLGLVGKQLRKYQQVVAKINGVKTAFEKGGMTYEQYQESMDNLNEDLEDASKIKIDPVHIESHNNTQNPSGKGSPSDKDKTKNKQYIDWIERRITRINNVISNISARIENIGKWGQKIGKNGFGWADKFAKLKGDKYDDKRVELTNKALEKEIKYYKDLAKMEQLASKKYNRKANEVVKSKQGKKVFKGKDGSLMLRRIKSGKYKKSDFQGSTWYQQLTDKQKEIVDAVIDFYDKGKSAKQAKQEAIANARNAQTQIYQNKQTKYDTRKSRAEAREAITTGYKGQNKQVDIQIQEMQKSYKQQIKIAKLEGNMAEAERLQYEMKKERSELLLREFENIQNDFDRLRGRNERRVQDAQNLIDVAEAEGRRVSANWYGVQNIQYRKEYDSYKKQYDTYLAQLEKINNGQMTADNLEEVMNKIQEAQNGMAESLTKTAENLTKIRELEDSIYDEIRNNNNEVYEDAQFLTSMYREDSINTRDRDNGYYKFSEAGLARMSTANVGIGVANSNADMDAKQYNRYRNLYETVSAITDEKERQQKLEEAGFSSMEQLLEQQKKYKKSWQDDIKARQEAENQMIDLMKEYYEGQKTYLGELIDARKKLLDEEKELYDYEKNINEKTKNIATLQKRLVALRGDTSEEGRARRRQIENQLDQAQQDLQDTEYERWKTDQENMLTNLQEQFNDIVDQHLKYPDQLLEESKQLLTDNKTTLTNIGNHLTTELTQSNMQSAFETALGTITMPSTSLIEEKLGTVNGYLLAIANKVGADYKGAEDGLNTNDGSGENGKTGKDYTDGDPNTTTTTTTKKTTIDDLLRNPELDFWLKNPDIGKKPSKKRSDYKALNQRIYDMTNGEYIIPDAKAAERLYLAMGGNPNKWKDKNWGQDTGVLYKLLKSKVRGFKTGGIGTLVKASGEDGLAMVRNGEGFVAPEHVQSIQQLLKVTPDLTQVMSNKNNTNQTTIDTLRLELPNVQDVRGFVEEFQTNKEVQRIFSIGVNDLVKTGHLTSNIHRL